MKKSFIRLVSFIITVFMLGSMFIGCTKKEPTTNTTTTTGNSVNTTTTVEADVPVYPLKTDVTIKWWLRQTNNKLTNTGESDWAKLLQEKTGVKIEFTNPPFGNDQEKDAFNILLASGDLPDIISYHWGQATFYPGGPAKALGDGIALELNSVMEKWAPNLSNVYNENPEWAKAAKTDDGKFWMFPFIRGDQSLMTFRGPILREDWLKELELEIPETIDEWYTVLKAFKDEKGATAPLSVQDPADSGAFVGAYGIKRDFFIENGKVVYGPMLSAYKDFLVNTKKWYDEGLLDKNFATLDGQTITANITSGKSGATVSNAGGGIGNFLGAMKDKDPNYSVIGSLYPVLNKGDKAMFGQADFAIPGTDCSVVNAKSKNIEVAVRLLDYGYSPEGILVMNFGREGLSYTMVNDYPTYTDEIFKNPVGYTLNEAIGFYFNGTSNPTVQDKRYIEQYFAYDQQKKSVPRWANTDNPIYSIPGISHTTEEASQVTKIMADVTTYEKEMFLKFVVGVEPLENFDKYVEQLKQMGIEDVIKLKQAALDRYNNR